MTQENVWTLQCFGGFRARQAQRTIERFPTQKTAALLALLALRGAQNREAVCALLWPDKAPEAARNSLSAALSALRRELGPDIVTADRQRIALSPGVLRTDVEEFDNALKQGHWDRAVELYRGSLLPSFHEDPFPALNGEYEEKARGAFIGRIKDLEKGGSAEALRNIARRAALLFGDDQRWFLALMRAHQRAGDLEAAIRAYESLGRFARKNGEVASETARALAKTLRREREQVAQAPAAPTSSELRLDSEEETNTDAHAPTLSAASNLPPAWTRFFGREAERELLRAWLCQMDSGALLVTLSGAGGSGKTRLAIETLRSAITDEAFCSAQHAFFVPLASLSDAELLHGTIRDTLGLPVAPSLVPLEQLKRSLQGEKCLFLLDNFEQLMPEGAEKLQVLRQTLPRAAFIVTSRVLLNLPGEREFPVAPLPTPLPNSSTDDVNSSPSVALFCDRAGIRVDASNAEAVSALCRRLDGIPLALELAAARAKMLSPAQILERLASHPNFLQSREFGLPARHQTLRATIEWSTQLLSPELQQFFSRLSVFRGGWTLEAAESVCNEPDALDYLTLLRESSLVRVEANGNDARFRMLETLREFGQEQLGDERTTIERARFDFYLKLAQQAASAMQGPEQTSWLGRLDVEQDNLRASLEWARENDPVRGLQMATALIDFWETRLSLDEGRHWIETFLSATETATAPQASTNEARSRALTGAGRLAWYAYDLDTAQTLLEQGLQTARQSDDLASSIYALHSSARLAAVAGDYARARELGYESVRLSRQSHDKALLMSSLVDLAPTFIQSADFANLREVCQEAIGLARELGDQHALALALYEHAIAEHYEGHYQPALSHLAESEALLRHLDARWDLTVCLCVIGSVRRELGQFELAATALRESLLLTRELGLESIVVISFLLAVAYLLLRRGDNEQATRLMGASDAFAVKIGHELPAYTREENVRYRSEARTHLGNVIFEREWEIGQSYTLDQAIDFGLRHCSHGHHPHPPTDHVSTRARALNGAGRLAWYSSDMVGANTFLEKGIEEAQQAGDQSALIYATRNLARVAAVAGESDRANELGHESVRLARETGDAGLLSESLLDMAFVHFNVGDFDIVESNTQEALALTQRVGDEGALAYAFTLLACIREAKDQLDEALEWSQKSETICRRLGIQWELMVNLTVQGQIWSKKGDFARSQSYYNQALIICRDTLLTTWHVVTALLSLSWAWMRAGDFQGTAQLMGASEALRQSIDYTLMSSLVATQQQFEGEVRQQLGEVEFERLWKIGHAMTPTEAVEFAMRPVSGAPQNSKNDALMAERARALSGAGRLAWYNNDFEASRALVIQGLETARDSGDLASFVYAVAAFVRFSASTGDIEGDIARGRIEAKEALRLSRAVNNPSLVLESIIALGYASTIVNELEGMGTLHKEALTLARELRDDTRLAITLTSFATVLYSQGHYAEAQIYLEECIPLSRRLDSPFILFAAMWILSNVEREVGDLDAATKSVTECLEICRANTALGWNTTNALLSASYLWVQRGEWPRAATLMSASLELGEQLGYKLVPLLRLDLERYCALVQEKLSPIAFDTAWEQGRNLNLEAAIDLAVALPSPSVHSDTLAARSRALSGAGRLAWHDSDFEASRALVQQGLDAARQSGDLASFVYAVAAFVRFAMVTGDVEGYMREARLLSEEAVQKSRNNRVLLLESLISLGYAHTIVSRFKEAQQIEQQAVALARQIGDEGSLARALNCLAAVHFHQGQYDAAQVLLEESVPICRSLGSTWDLVAVQWTISGVAREQGRLDVAAQAINEVLELCRPTPAFRWGLANALLTSSYLHATRGQHAVAAQLMGASQAFWETAGYHLVPILRPEYEHYRKQIRKALGETNFEAALLRGGALSPDAAIDLAIKESLPPVYPDLLAARSRALSGAGRLAWHDSDFEASRLLVHQGLDSARQSGDLSSFVYSVAAFVRFAMVTGDIEGYLKEARLLSEEAVQRAREAGDKPLLLESLLSLGYSYSVVGAYEAAFQPNEGAIALARELGDESNLVRVLTNQASVYYHTGRYPQARAVIQECKTVCRRLNSPWDLTAILWMESNLTREQGRLEEARQIIAELLAIHRANPTYRWGLINISLSFSYLCLVQGQPRHTAILMGTAHAMLELTGYHLVPGLRPEFDRYKASALEALGETAFREAWEEGALLTPEEAIELALNE